MARAGAPGTGPGSPWRPALGRSSWFPTWAPTVCTQLGGHARVFPCPEDRPQLQVPPTPGPPAGLCAGQAGSLQSRGRPPTSAGTHADGQHWPHFEHGIAVGALTDVGIVSTRGGEAQLHSHVLDEGLHPGRASSHTHKLQTENSSISRAWVLKVGAPLEQHLLELARSAGPFPGLPQDLLCKCVCYGGPLVIPVLLQI